MSGYTLTVSTIAVISRENPLVACDLAQACGTDMDWVCQLVEVGIVAAQNPESTPDDWLFDSADLQHALEAHQLERDFGVGLEAAALILDLQHEVRRLKAVLHARAI